VRPPDVLRDDRPLSRLSYLLFTSQLVIAGVFAVAAVGKLRAPAAFVASLAGFGLPARRARPVAAGVIAAEAAVVPLALIPATAVAGLVLATLLLTTFALAIVRTLRRGLRPRCRCLGAAGAPLRKAHVARNAALALLAAAGALAAAVTSPDLEAAPLAVAALIAAVALLVLATLDDLLEVVSS
jgi:hypothetical protein